VRDANLVLRWIGRRKARSALLILATAVSFLLFGVLLAIRGALLNPGTEASQLRLVTSNTAGIGQELPLSYLDRIVGIDGVVRVAPRAGFGASFRNERRPIIVIATDPAPYLAIQRGITVPRAQREAFVREPGALLVGSAIARQLGIRAGDRIQLRSSFMMQGTPPQEWSFDVAGIFNGDGATGSSFALMHYSYYNQSRRLRRDLVGNFLIETADARQNDRIIAAIDARFGNSPHETVTSTERAYNRALLTQIGDISMIVLLLLSGSLVALLMIVANNMAISVRERFREIAILKAIGFSSRRVAGLVVAEILIISLAGGAIGLSLAGLVLAAIRSMPGEAFSTVGLTPGIVAGAVATMIALAIVAGSIPAVMALRLSVVRGLARR
jgi:putative ABC transport system permease protein